MKPGKILIIGIYGSGKSTLANKISKILKIKTYDQDNIKYKRKYDKIRGIKEIKTKIKEIANKKQWIFSGTWLDYLDPLYKKSDIVIFLEIPQIELYKRIIKRHFERKKNKNNYIEHNLKTSWGILRKVRKYFKDPNCYLTLQKHKDYIRKHSKKQFIVKNNKDIEKLIKNLNEGKL